MRYGVASGVLFAVQHQAHPRVPDEKMVSEDAHCRDDCGDERELDQPRHVPSFEQHRETDTQWAVENIDPVG